MKRIFTLCIVLCTIVSSFAQTDTTGTQKPAESDTIRIGGMIIIRKPGSKSREIVHDREYKYRSRHSEKPSNISTNWWIVDLGFSNFTDHTNYGSAAADAYAPGSNKTWFALKDGKSRNVNIWFFMQRLNMIKHVVNLKYGLGLELNNYRYKQPVRYDADPPATVDPPRVILDNATPGRSYRKDKLAADYLTVPIMINFNFTPNRNKGFGISAGISAGYLYSARNKTITSDEKKKKAKDDFELQKWKLSYVAELALGPVRFYGSYALKNMYERGLDMTPYNFGFRFSNW
jgi:Outer membrane protein beta-barrel domain